MNLRKYSVLATSFIVMGLLSGCGGGSSTSSTTPTTQTTTISGKVLDGGVDSARVCFDVNHDLQCTAADKFTTTNADGSYELSVSSSTIEQSQLIADIRASEVTDSDYARGIPDYDYVLTGFNVKSDRANHISPLSSYMRSKQSRDQLTVSEVSNQVSTSILTKEQFQYAASSGSTTVDFGQYLNSDFIANKSDADPAVADFNTRLHNINEVMAREMQESQAYWEDAYYNGSFTPKSTLWSDNSAEIVENSQFHIFENFETIVTQVTSVDYTGFDAELIASTLTPKTPPAAALRDFQNYLDLLGQAETEFSGSTYKYTSFLNGTVLVVSYIQFTADSVVVYAVVGSICTKAAVPVPFTGQTEAEFISTFNQTLGSTSFDGVSFSSIVKVASPPAGCSSVKDLLNAINTPVAAGTDSNSTQVEFVRTDFSAGIASAASIGVNIHTPANPPTPTASLSGGTNLAAGTLNQCNYGGLKYAINPCRAATRKD